MDSMIEELLLPCLDKRAIATINSKLTAEFGFCRLSKDPVAVAERIIKRSRIQSSAEGEIAKELVADQRTIDRIGTENYNRLAVLLDKWERQG